LIEEEEDEEEEKKEDLLLQPGRLNQRIRCNSCKDVIIIDDNNFNNLAFKFSYSTLIQRTPALRHLKQGIDEVSFQIILYINI